MDFHKPLSVEAMAEIIAAEMRERLGVRMVSAVVQAAVTEIATRAAGVWLLTGIVSEDSDPQSDALATPLIGMANQLVDKLYLIACDERMKGTLAYDIAERAFKIGWKFYPLIVQKVLGQ
jgi:hypothetical protein